MGVRATMQTITEHSGADPAGAITALESGEPFIVRGIAAHWPVVAAARSGDHAVLAYLRSTMARQDIAFAEAAPQHRGRFHYNADLTGFTFTRRRLPSMAFLDELAGEITAATPRTIAAQGIVAQAAAPLFEQANPLPICPGQGEARLWIGNRARVAAHSDPAENLAYCAAGRRRFTLFAPEQVGNLYLGPFEPTPAGTPIAMTDPLEPDLKRYPRFATAMDAALVADLEPGDALYIPYGWFHHVEALSAVSVLFNYWWNASSPALGSAWDVLLHAFTALRPLAPTARRHWAAMLLHYGLERDGPAGAHLPCAARGVLDAREQRDLATMRAILLRNLSRQDMPPDRQ